jgi:hypothetical protein
VLSHALLQLWSFGCLQNGAGQQRAYTKQWVSELPGGYGWRRRRCTLPPSLPPPKLS